MISAKDTIYPLIKEDFDFNELIECFTPSDEEINFCKNETRTENNFLCMLIILKSNQRYGYAVMIKDMPKKIIKFISEKVEINITNEVIIEYDSSRIRRHHLPLIKDYLKIKSFSDEGEKIVSLTSYNLSKAREDIADIMNGVIDTLIRERFELPAFSTLLRECYHQKAKVYKEIFKMFSFP